MGERIDYIAFWCDTLHLCCHRILPTSRAKHSRLITIMTTCITITFHKLLSKTLNLLFISTISITYYFNNLNHLLFLNRYLPPQKTLVDIDWRHRLQDGVNQWQISQICPLYRADFCPTASTRGSAPPNSICRSNKRFVYSQPSCCSLSVGVRLVNGFPSLCGWKGNMFHSNVS